MFSKPLRLRQAVRTALSHILSLGPAHGLQRPLINFQMISLDQSKKVFLS